jgi:hypothetical protein
MGIFWQKTKCYIQKSYCLSNKIAHISTLAPSQETKVAKKLPKSCQKVAKKLPKSCQKVAKKLPKSCQKVKPEVEKSRKQ